MKVQILNFDKKYSVGKKRLIHLSQKLFKKFSSNPLVKRSRSQQMGFFDLTIVFLPEKQAKNINLKYRKKNYATDILSFSSEEPNGGLGELVLCPMVLKRQAQEQGHSFKKELDYMIIHGFLHLLGYDHEKSHQEELKMMKLQDKLFKALSED